MSDFEGSVNLEGFDEVDETTEETQDNENINNSEDESNTEESENNQENQESQEEESQDENKGESEEGQKTTDKGTKLDSNPKSAVHQQLANANREMQRYQEFLQDPKAVRKYLEDLEGELGEKTGETKEQIRDKAEDENLVTDPSKIQTPEDLQSYIKFLTKGIEKEKESFRKERESFNQQATEKAINERLVSDIDTLQNKYPFLRATNADGSANPEFDAELEKEITDQYQELDFDKKSGKFLGKISILSIAERAIRIRKLGEATGSKKAQTVVQDKRAGAVKTGGGKTTSSDESKMTSTQLIASRIAKARGNK